MAFRHSRGGDAPHIAIIGAGPGGLASAVLLSAAGLRVTVYEAQDRVGGRTGRVRLPAGDGRAEFGFDRGATFFMMPHVLDEIFRAAGTTLGDEVEMTRLDPMYRLVLGRAGREPLTLDTTQDIAAMSERIGAIDDADGRAFERFIADNRAKLSLMESILRRPIRGPLDLLDLDTIRVGPRLHPTLSVHELLSKYFRDEHVRLAVAFQSKYLGMSPFECPSLFTILPFIEYEFGVWHPTGGCNALLDAMARVAERGGAAIRTSSPVEAILFDGARADGVVVNGERIGHDAVVVNADATWALKHLVPADVRERLGTWGSDASIDRRRYSCSTFMLYLGVDGALDLPHHTIYTSGSYRQNLEDITTHGRVPSDPSLYVCNASATDATLAPEGASSVYVLVPVSNLKTSGGAVDWRVEGPRLREETLDQMSRVLGVGDLRPRIRAELAVTPDDWRTMNINHGATFNLAHSLDQMLHKRPQNRLKGVDGVYLAGGGTHPGSGLPTIFLSAQIGARQIARDLGVACAMDRVRAVRTLEARGWEPRAGEAVGGASLVGAM
ncbi:MAG: phytoene desaturase [Phycisphaeraceae bacterium]|nr:phytoene desaturase [Phycisphaeraceae bacterium]